MYSFFFHCSLGKLKWTENFVLEKWKYTRKKNYRFSALHKNLMPIKLIGEQFVISFRDGGECRWYHFSFFCGAERVAFSDFCSGSLRFPQNASNIMCTHHFDDLLLLSSPEKRRKKVVVKKFQQFGAPQYTAVTL